MLVVYRVGRQYDRPEELLLEEDIVELFDDDEEDYSQRIQDMCITRTPRKKNSQNISYAHNVHKSSKTG